MHYQLCSLTPSGPPILRLRLDDYESALKSLESWREGYPDWKHWIEIRDEDYKLISRMID